MAGTREQPAAGDPGLDPSPHLPELREGKAAGDSSSRSTPGHGLMLELQPRYLQPARETGSAHSIPGSIPAASCHRQTCTAVHEQMSFDNSGKKCVGGKRPEYQQRVSHFLSSAAALRSSVAVTTAASGGSGQYLGCSSAVSHPPRPAPAPIAPARPRALSSSTPRRGDFPQPPGPAAARSRGSIATA